MKKIRVLIVFLFLLFLLVNCKKLEQENEEIYHEWNGGKCVNDGGRLNYVSTGSKYHYRCEICDKEYVFEGAQKYE